MKIFYWNLDFWYLDAIPFLNLDFNIGGKKREKKKCPQELLEN